MPDEKPTHQLTMEEGDILDLVKKWFEDNHNVKVHSMRLQYVEDPVARTRTVCAIGAGWKREKEPC